MSSLLISIVVCAYNEENRLEECLSSLEKQTLPPEYFEIIVVDDGSSDRTASLAESFAERYSKPGGGVCRCVRMAHAGLSHARNVGMHVSRAPLVAFIDADAVARSDWALETVKLFDANPEVLVCGGKVELLNHESRVARMIHSEVTVQDRMNPPRLMLMGTNMAFRRGFFHEGVGFYHPFVSRGDESIVLGAEGLSHSYRTGRSPCGRLLLSPRMVVYNERPENYVAWLKERFDNGKLYAMSADILGRMNADANEYVRAYRKYPLMFPIAFAAKLARFPVKFSATKRILPVHQALMAVFMQVIASLLEFAGYCSQRVSKPSYKIHAGLNSLHESARLILKVSP